MDFKAMEIMIRATNNKELLLGFYKALEWKDEAERTTREIFQEYIKDEKYIDAIEFGYCHHLHSDVAVLCKERYEDEMKNGNYQEGMAMAKNNYLGGEKIRFAAIKIFKQIANNPHHEPSQLIELAENELKDRPRLLKKAVRVTFKRKLGWMDFSEMIDLTEKYPVFFNQYEKDMAIFLNDKIK